MQQIFPTSPQWNHVRFRIQLSLADPSVQLIRVVKYVGQFDAKHMAHLKIDCGINVTDMEETELETLKYGNPSRYIFQAGHLKMGNLSADQANKTNKILLFKLAVNQLMPIHKSGASQLQHITQFPGGIDTIYISQNKQELNIYPHQYRVKDKSQCCLEYEVDFIRKGVPSLPKWNKDDIICQYCENAKALYHCPQDREVYCGKCYEELHRSTKKKSHVQMPVSAYNCAPYCSFHGKQRQVYYCLECMELKCEKCIENEAHKSKKKHTQIVLLPQLQKMLKDKQLSFLKQSKQKTKALILKTEQALSKLTSAYEHQKNDLQQKFALKLTKLREESNRKIMRVMGLHSQLRRKYDELLWVQNFLAYCEEFLLAEDSIRMKDSFFVYLERITMKDYYQQIDKSIAQTLQ